MTERSERHVEHLLAGYVSGQLTAGQSARVRRHTAACSRCRARLTGHERLAGDLRLVLKQWPAPREGQVEAWWQAIRTRPIRRERPSPRLMLAPVLLTALLLMLPLLAGTHFAAQPARSASTTTLPAINTTLEPPGPATVFGLASFRAEDTPGALTPTPADRYARLMTPVPPIPTELR